MPEDYCAKLLGTHWEGRFWASENKVFWTVKCIEYPEYNEVCVFVDGDRTEIPSMPVMGGKVSNKFNISILIHTIFIQMFLRNQTVMITVFDINIVRLS